MSDERGAWLAERWFGGTPPELRLRLLSAAYGLATGLRRRAYAWGLLPSHRIPAPVLVVGNLIVGGAGKTPLTVALAQGLRERGWRPGVVSRGYGRQSTGPVQVEDDTPPEACGDEPLLIRRRTGVPVRVDRDRVAAARALVAQGCNLVLADDGLQHYRLARDLEIEVVDGLRRYGNGRLLPAGPLREPIARGARCALRVANGGLANEGELPMHLLPGMVTPLDGRPPVPLSALQGRRVHAVAGIGHPQRFFQMLRDAGLQVVEHAFPDHHPFQAADFAFADGLPVLLTEKDAVKLPPGQLRNLAYIPVDAALPAEFWRRLQQQLAALGPAPPRETPHVHPV
jgi:tetraacyldisaccharide 4'-kinase